MNLARFSLFIQLRRLFTNKISIFNWMLTQFFALSLRNVFKGNFYSQMDTKISNFHLQEFTFDVFTKYFFILTRDFFSFWGKFFISSIDFLLQSLSTHTRMGFKVPRFSAREINTISLQSKAIRSTFLWWKYLTGSWRWRGKVFN